MKTVMGEEKTALEKVMLGVGNGSLPDFSSLEVSSSSLVLLLLLLK